jgi:aminopeptidase S
MAAMTRVALSTRLLAVGMLAGAWLTGGCTAQRPPESIDPPATTLDATPTASPTATATAFPTPDLLTADELAASIDAGALSELLEALQRVADDHGGHRATGSTGFDASVAYVAGRLAEAGYDVGSQQFTVDGVASTSLIVERVGEASRQVVMLGAHLDSVVAGPGINDNGSGVAALLVIAEGLAELPAPQRTIRIAFWGAEEGGPHGSAAYVATLEDVERTDLVAYLNFDMIGSPNAIRFVYDEAAAAAPGSDDLTALFGVYFDEMGLAWAPVDLEGDSDHGPFVDAGIPTGGLFSGGIEPVTDAQAATFGAIAGHPADPCSHRACDIIDNVDLATLEEMARAIAHVLVQLAGD